MLPSPGHRVTLVPPPPARRRSIAARSSWAALVLCAFVGLSLRSPLHGGEIAIRGELFAGVWSPFGTRWLADSPVCLWERGGEGVFVVTASGRSDDGQFRLSNAAGDTVRYRVFWHRRDANGPREKLEPGRASRHGVRPSARPDCGGGANARLSVRIDRRDIERAPSGVYTDSLLLTLSSL